MIGAVIWGAGKLWSFAKSPLGRRAFLLVAVAVAFWGYGELRFRAGVAHEKAAQAERVKKAKAHVVKVEAKGQAITTDVAGKLADRKTEIRTITQTLTKEVVRYVPVESDRACVVPAGFVRLHDAAARGAVLPEPAGGPLDADSGLALSTVAETVVANYGSAHELAAEVIAWREWYARQADLWKREVKAPSSRP